METTRNNSENSLSECGQQCDQAVSKAAVNTSEALDVAIEVLEDIQRVVSGGRPKTVKIKFGNRVVAEVPVALTAAAAVAAGLAAVLLTKLTIEVEHEESAG